MRALSEKLAGIVPSATIAISTRAKQMQADGIDVISLSIGEPDFDTPEPIRKACIAALARGDTHYAPSDGIPELRRAIAVKIQKENGFPCKPDEVIATCGAKDAIHEAMQAVLNPGDEVIITDPAWVSYEPCVLIAGGKAVHHPLNTQTFQIDDTLLERVTVKTRMMVLNSPSNPSGAVLSDESQKLVADIATDYDLFVLSDEIYEKLIYGKVHRSFASIGDMAGRTITVNGFSKAYAMTGWRLGYAVAPVEIIRNMSKIQQHTVSQPTTFVMWGGVEALTGDQRPVELMRQEFDRRRTYVIRELASMGLLCAPADGAFYAFVRIEGDDMDVSRKLLEEGRVAVTPGEAFCAPGWIRISYAASMERLIEAMERIRPFF
jgi:aspartate aminotransferase